MGKLDRRNWGNGTVGSAAVEAALLTDTEVIMFSMQRLQVIETSIRSLHKLSTFWTQHLYKKDSLNPGDGDSLDELLLAEEENHQHRQDHDARRRHEQVPLSPSCLTVIELQPE